MEGVGEQRKEKGRERASEEGKGKGKGSMQAEGATSLGRREGRELAGVAMLQIDELADQLGGLSSSKSLHPRFGWQMR